MAQPNQLNPNIYSMSFRNGTAIISGGTATGTIVINGEVGTPAEGSLYMSTNAGGFLAMVINGKWQKISATQNT